MSNFIVTRIFQVLALLYQAIATAKHNLASSVFRLLIPTLIVFCFWVAMFGAPSGEVLHPTPTEYIGNIPVCQPGIKNRKSDAEPTCTTLLYHPDTPQVRSVVSILLQQNNISSTESSVQATNMTTEEFIEFVKQPANFNTTQGYVHFDTNNITGDLLYPGISYTLMYNNTQVCDILTGPSAPACYSPTNFEPQMQLALDKALITYFGELKSHNDQLGAIPQPDLKVRFKDFPNPSTGFVHALMSAMVCTFLFISITIPFIFQLQDIVAEREKGLRGYMRSMGLRDSSWWIANLLHHSCWYIIPLLLMTGVGYLVQLEYFSKSAFIIHCVIFGAFSFSNIAFVMLLSTILATQKVAVFVGFILFLLGVTFASITASLDIFTFQLWSQSFLDDHLPWGVLLSALPPFSVTVAMLNIKLQTMGTIMVFVPPAAMPEHVGWSSMSQNPPVFGLFGIGYAPTIMYSVWFMIGSGCAFMLLALYFDAVLPRADKRRESLLFFVNPFYWFPSLSSRSIDDYAANVGFKVNGDGDNGSSFETTDEDVLKEREQVLSGANDMILRVCNVRKTFWKFSPWCLLPWTDRWQDEEKPKTQVRALQGLTIGAESNQILCILGENGAGKTTLQQIATGLLAQDSGDVFICGHSVSTSLSAAQAKISICAQFDVLWEHLTAFECLYIMTMIKTGWFADSDVIHEALNEVRLHTVAHKACGGFSGGMKRRLSVALSTIGNPEVIFMDEPTTGMDPANRRKVWDYLLRLKQNRLIVMTTHDMNEADVIGDKIAMFAKGRLQAVGTSLHLKSKFSTGYRLSLVCDEGFQNTVMSDMHRLLPVAELLDGSASSLVYSLPVENLEESTELFEYLTNGTYFDGETNKNIIRDWGLSNASLEDAFLQLTSPQYS